MRRFLWISWFLLISTITSYYTVQIFSDVEPSFETVILKKINRYKFDVERFYAEQKEDSEAESE